MLLFQDLSKAYDRVDLKFLKMALERIKVPSSFTKMLINLFTNRKNSVFTEFSNTDLYNIKIGIDQGEVISPLLWIIYYDPLLCEIQNYGLGYTMTHTWKQDIFRYETSTLTQEIPSLAFIDDTTWITPSQNNLEKILDIADDFYRITNTAINKDKSKLITNKKIQSDNIDLKFGDNSINIEISKEPIRFLGVWISLNKQNSKVTKMVKEEIKKFTNIIKRKPITDKQMGYIVNMVLIPLVTYRLQNMILSQNSCNELMAPVRKMFKNKLKFAFTAPNCLTQGSQFYNVTDLWQTQLKRHSSYLITIFNSDKLLYKVAKIRLFQLQH